MFISHIFTRFFIFGNQLVEISFYLHILLLVFLSTIFPLLLCQAFVFYFYS